jgi:catechol 2,3-dioxygenase-like lactoylglutathione lyase family enzyme
MAEHDFMPLLGWDHVELWVGNAKQAAYWYESALGFDRVAYASSSRAGSGATARSSASRAGTATPRKTSLCRCRT